MLHTTCCTVYGGLYQTELKVSISHKNIIYKNFIDGSSEFYARL